MLKQATIRDFLDNPDCVEPEDVELFARELISDDYAPCFADEALAQLPDIPDGKLSSENAKRLGELEERLEREWWERTGNALLAELLGKQRTAA